MAETFRTSEQVVFYLPKRGAPPLPRAWRTPEASPTRGVGDGLPGCKPAFFIIEDAGTDIPTDASTEDSHSDPAASPEAGRSALPSRTPSCSPSPRGRATWGPSPFAASGAWGRDPSALTPMPEASTSPGGVQAGCAPPACPQGSWCNTSASQAVVVCPTAMAVHWAAAHYMYQPSSAEPASANFDRSARGRLGEAGSRVPPPPPPPPATACFTTSMGSVGHPFTCAEACKYATKPKGCKDGTACAHCHHCEWSRHAGKRVAMKRRATTRT